MKKYLLPIALAFLPVASSAEITPKQAEQFLLVQPPVPMSNKVPKQYRDIESLTKPMFFMDQKENLEQGYKNYLTLKNKADMHNPYAAFNVGVYQAINQDKFKFDYKTTLMYLKLGSDGGIDESKYALALIYANKSNEVATLINSNNRLQGESFEAEVQKNELQLRDLSNQYILELARKGHKKAFMTACNYYVKGEYLEKSIQKAALCYNNAVRAYDLGSARGFLAKMYFDLDYFDSIEFEQKGVELSKKAIEQGSVYAMVNLGKQLIYPKYLPYSDVETGRLLLQGAAAQGDKTAIKYLVEYFDGAGELIQRSNKPNKNGYYQN